MLNRIVYEFSILWLETGRSWGPERAEGVPKRGGVGPSSTLPVGPASWKAASKSLNSLPVFLRQAPSDPSPPGVWVEGFALRCTAALTSVCLFSGSQTIRLKKIFCIFSRFICHRVPLFHPLTRWEALSASSFVPFVLCVFERLPGGRTGLALPSWTWAWGDGQIPSEVDTRGSEGLQQVWVLPSRAPWGQDYWK